MLDLRQCASVWIDTSFRLCPRMDKHANAWSTHFLQGLLSTAREKKKTTVIGSLRLTGWHPHAVCCQTPVHYWSCTRNAHTTVTNPTQTPTNDRVRTRHSWSWSCGRAHTIPPRAPTDRQSAGWHRGLASGHRNLMRTTMASSAPAAPCADDAGLWRV